MKKNYRKCPMRSPEDDFDWQHYERIKKVHEELTREGLIVDTKPCGLCPRKVSECIRCFLDMKEPNNLLASGGHLKSAILAYFWAF